MFVSLHGHVTVMGKVAVLVHGWSGHGFYIWMKPLAAALQDAGVECISPTFPEPKDPRYGPWRDELLKILREHCDGNEIFFIAHSLGGYFVMRFLAEFADDPLVKSCKGAVLVGATATKRPEYKPFYDEDIGWERLRAVPMKWIAMWSCDDPVVGEEHGSLIREQLSETGRLQFVLLDGFKHFVVRELPNEILENVKTCLNIRNE